MLCAWFVAGIEYHNLRSGRVFSPMPTSDALTFAEAHLNQHAERYIERFETWHGIRNR